MATTNNKQTPHLTCIQHKRQKTKKRNQRFLELETARIGVNTPEISYLGNETCGEEHVAGSEVAVNKIDGV
jgi:hypothetical protein